MSWDDKRPMSPHLQVYKLPLTAKLSILHRATGAALFIGLILMVWVLVAGASGATAWQSMHSFFIQLVWQVGFIRLYLFALLSLL